VKDGSGNPFTKRSKIKDCNGQLDLQRQRGMMKQAAGEFSKVLRKVS
jgi:hypothetical protein